LSVSACLLSEVFDSNVDVWPWIRASQDSHVYRLSVLEDLPVQELTAVHNDQTITIESSDK